MSIGMAGAWRRPRVVVGVRTVTASPASIRQATQQDVRRLIAAGRRAAASIVEEAADRCIAHIEVELENEAAAAAF